MKVVMAYGDSLTWGSNAESEFRHRYEDRWPSVLEAGLGGQVRVIAEGLGGRTTVYDDYSAAADRNGVRLLPTLLATHSPLDAVVIMLGTNDLKPFVSGSAIGAAAGMKRLAQIIQTYPYDRGAPVPRVVLVSPPLAGKTAHIDLGPLFDGAIEESKLFAGHYERVAREMGCAFFDAATIATVTPIDGIHLDAANTRAIGTALVPVVRQVLGL